MPAFGAVPSLAVLSAAAVMSAALLRAAPANATEPQIDPNSAQAQAEAHKLAAEPTLHPLHGHHVSPDTSGRKQAGDASIYALHFQGRRMANGKRFDHRANVAASKTLPLGTIAKVTNLDTGRTAVVAVEDHGPYVDGRTIDVTRSTARQLGIEKKQGVAPVIVAPVVVPQPDGTLKPGAGAMPGPATAK